MLGRAKATMPSRQADLDLNQKSACRKNQNKRPCPGHSAPRGTIGLVRSPLIDFTEDRSSKRASLRRAINLGFEFGRFLD